jgi:hypothetical protein
MGGVFFVIHAAPIGLHGFVGGCRREDPAAALIFVLALPAIIYVANSDPQATLEDSRRRWK